MPRSFTVFGHRLADRDVPVWLRCLWSIFALLVVLTVPSQLWLGGSVWSLDVVRVPQVMAMGMAFLAFSLFIAYAARRSGTFRLSVLLVAGFGCFLAAYLVLLRVPGYEHSRIVMALSAITGVTLALVPSWMSPRRILAFGLPVLGLCLALSVLARRIADQRPAAEQTELRNSALYRIQMRVQTGLFEPVQMDGGAIERYGDRIFVATGDGDFYELKWNSEQTGWISVHLEIPSPLTDRTALRADPEQGNFRLRVTDMLIDDADGQAAIVVVHQAWNSDGRCFSMRVSRMAFAEPISSGHTLGKGWETLYETKPCLSPVGSYEDSETGGRLARHPQGGILLTVGDHGFDGRDGTALAQDTGSDYGKVLLLEPGGGVSVFSIGNRNPQGLAVDSRGNLWETEHGPRGGDELNLLIKGANYGWPLATYGTAYNALTWPLAPDAPNHGLYQEPVFAFVPSIAISAVEVSTGESFPKWEGDLLIGSLRVQTLFRVRLRGEKVTYVEPIPIGYEIRDLTETSNGRLLLWSDSGTIIELSPAEEGTPGEAVFQLCATCHEPLFGAPPSAPSLKGIVGRPVASLPGYAYSSALEAVDGVWTEEALDAFLTNPQAFAPGNTMQAGVVADAESRRAIIAYLRDYR